MIRTQVSLDQQEYEAARSEAAALGISVAEFVRRAIRDKLPTDSKNPWMRYAGMVETGDADSSLTVDDLVYGSKD